MPAEAVQQVGALRQRVDQMEPLDAAGRPLHGPTLHGHEDDRPVISLHELRGHDPDHAGVPPLTGQYDGRPLLQPRRFDLLDRLDEDLIAQRPPPLIFPVELRGDGVGLCGIIGGQQRHPHGGITQTAGRIQAGS